MIQNKKKTDFQTHKQRLYFLDAVRGFALINMIAYHTLYDIVYIFATPIDWYQSQIGYFWQQSICWCFILLSGFCFSLGKQPQKRGLMIFLLGCVISLVTAVAMPQQRVRFGILSLIGLSMLITAGCKPFLEKINPIAGAFGFFALFWLTKAVPIGGLGLGDRLMTPLSDVLYQTDFLYPLGFPSASFFSSDYFPLIPWLFLYWVGWFFARAAGDLKKVKLFSVRIPALEWVGKYSLWIYMIHQPVVYALLWIFYSAK